MLENSEKHENCYAKNIKKKYENALYYDCYIFLNYKPLAKMNIKIPCGNPNSWINKIFTKHSTMKRNFPWFFAINNVVITVLFTDSVQKQSP